MWRKKIPKLWPWDNKVGLVHLVWSECKLVSPIITGTDGFLTPHCLSRHTCGTCHMCHAVDTEISVMVVLGVLHPLGVPSRPILILEVTALSVPSHRSLALSSLSAVDAWLCAMAPLLGQLDQCYCGSRVVVISFLLRSSCAEYCPAAF